MRLKVSVSGKAHLWIVDRCPYCLQQHTHGGGKIGEHDPRKQLGHRHAHCGDPFQGKASLKGYILVEPESSDEEEKTA